MARADSPKLDFAYKYPFSAEAKELISSLNVRARWTSATSRRGWCESTRR